MKEITLDLKDYKKGGSVFKRTAARGIIKRDGKYLLIHGKYGDYKFPGGGMEKGESIRDTLIREVREETGYQVIPERVNDFLHVREFRKGIVEDICEMDSWYFICEVGDVVTERNLDEYEKEYGYELIWISLEDAIQRNESVEDSSMIPWIVRDTMVMRELLKDIL